MLTIIFKTLLSLFPFIREIVESYQKGPRDRRAKNPLTPWLVICIVFTLGLAVLSGKYVITLLEKEHAQTLQIETLEHQLSMNAEVERENTDLRRTARENERAIGRLTDENGVLTAKVTTLTGEVSQLTSRNAELTDKLDDTSTDLGIALKRNRLLEQQASNRHEHTELKVVTPVKDTSRKVYNKPISRVSNHTLALVSELSK